ncbi:EAL domain-containing protein [Thiohalomonas denitrificans]|uniref:cyclic-guanylate-specific phosphodiesterase n=1 Tax=Thiohalomonas denitrificans TaxID=415747 RepID=A0A1G5QVJ1_9GAMM|nr:EAL domain-containing protein [Thiohalomonas denitrificans]SCZ65855.1 PAS domain S-box-containing protein/diguanylate cyclase (GGDEF) domain-containing protein [Thiohalomonas denitrificans]
MTSVYRRLQLRHWTMTLFIAWSVAVWLLFAWNLRQINGHVHDQAYREIQTAFAKGETLSHWAIAQGGIYIEVDKETRPDPYLAKLSDRDITTPDGRILTLVNPATLLKKYYKTGDPREVHGRLTSLAPLNRANRPDPWEKKALLELAKSRADEVSKTLQTDSGPILRVMKARWAEPSCLKCHAEQGVKPGDLIGGVSLSVPFDQAFAEAEHATLGIGYGLLWLFGLAGIQYGGRQLGVRIRERDVAYKELEAQDDRIKAIVQGSLDAIVTFDQERRITGWNPGAETLFGWKEEDIIGQELDSILGREGHPDTHRLLPEGFSKKHVEATATHREGRRFPVELSISPLDSEIGSHAAFIRDITARKAAAEKIERDYTSQQIIARLLELSMEPLDFPRKLDRSLDIILSTPWLSLQSKGGIFLASKDDELELVSHRGLLESVTSGCGRIAFGHCLCGRTAEARKVVFADCIDHRHDNFFPGMQPHGHYCLPILSGDSLLGVLTLYVDHGHTRSPEEERFLKAIAHTLGGIIQRYSTEEQLRRAAFYDDLTQLPNRALFMDRLAQAIGRHSRGKPFAVLYFDLERFKNINDSLGHTAGDEVLRSVAERLSECVRPGDTVSRLGGDEFTVLLEALGSAEGAFAIANRIHQALAKPFLVRGHEVFTTASIGVALAHEEHRDVSDLLREADTAMYQAKQFGSGQTAIFDETMHGRALARLTLESELRRAAERSEFEVYFQPILATQDERLQGFEALIRWRHPERGLVSPAEFIPVAEETGLIHDIGRHVLEQACRQAAQWRKRSPHRSKPYVSVNLSAVQFAQMDLLEQVEGALRRAGLPGNCLALEITESVLMEGSHHVRKTLEALRKLGVRLYIDDFGTGYSSLSYLHEFPFDALKIDRRFTSNLLQGDEHRGIVEAVLAIARHLRMTVIAEGVEEIEQLQLLRRFGCEYVQGFYFSRPIPSEQTAEWLERTSCQPHPFRSHPAAR